MPVRPLRRSTSIRPAIRTLLICIGLVALTFTLFWRAGHFQFISYDDGLYVAANEHVLSGLRWSNVVWAFTTWHTGNWHPLTWISLMLEGHFFGKHASGYHLTNVFLHVANSVLLFLVVRQLTGSEWRSAFVAALFAVHPLHVESVAWISERKDVSSTLFFLLAISAYGPYAARPGPARYVLVALFFVLGLLCKSMLVTLPLVLLLLDFWPLRRLKQNVDLRRLLLEKVPLVIVAIAVSFIAFLAQRSAGATVAMTIYPLGDRLQNVLLSYERYLGKIFSPRDLVLPYPFSRPVSSLELIWAVALLAGLTVIAIKGARRCPYLCTGWFWFVGTLLPVIGLVQIGPQAMADRYTYIPSIGIFVAITWSFADATSTMRSRNYFNVTAAALALVALSWLCSIQIGYWRNTETLFRHSLAINPGEIVGIRNLANYYALQRRVKEAIACFEVIVAQTPRDAYAHFQLGQELDAIGDQRRAIDEYARALELSLDNDKHNVTTSALNNLAWIRATALDPALRDGAEAVRLAERSCELTVNPDADQLDTLAAAYAEAGDFNRATETADRALQLAESAHNESLRAEIAKHVDLFRRQMPCHEDKR